jgi:hypothetical protein
MRIVKPGLEYVLEGFGQDQVVSFTGKDSEGNFLPGTTNEEVLNVLIERMYHLDSKRPSADNKTAIIQLKTVRVLLKKRVNKKLKRKQEYEEQQRG